MNGPECQMTSCDAEATESVDHPRFDTVQICATCASLFEVATDE
jgi:hypothetical protein